VLHKLLTLLAAILGQQSGPGSLSPQLAPSSAFQFPSTILPTHFMNPDTYFFLSAMAFWLAYHVWHSMWHVFDSIRHYNLATVFPFGSGNAHPVISGSQSRLPSVPSPVGLSVTCLGGPQADNFKALPRLYPIYPADGSKGDTTVEYVLCFESKMQTNSYLASSQFMVLRPPLPKHGLHMSKTQNQRVVHSIG
jgi:hypothetical protein